VNQLDLFDRWRRFSDWIAANSIELLTALGIAAAIVALLVGLRALIRRKLGGPEASGWRKILAGIFGRTNLFFIVMVAAKLVMTQVDLPANTTRFINILFIAATALQLAIWTRALIIGWIEHRVGAGEEHRTLGTAIGLIRVLVTIVVFAIAIVVVFDNLGVNVTGLVAGLGIGGIAIGLAAQGIFSDLFAALAIIFDRPFRKGDTINVGGAPGGQTGTVENIGLKTTRVRALDGELVAYGNAELLKMRIHNYALMQHRRIVLHFGVTYETAPELLEKIPGEVQAIIEAQDHASFDRSHLMGFGASSLDYETIYIVDSPEFPVFAHARHGIMLALIKRFAELGINFAYPTQTTYTAAPDGTLVMPWPPGMAKE
jgi:small-conductance mechanosensitive channel